MLDIDSKQTFLSILTKLSTGELHTPQWNFDRPDIGTLTNAEKIAIRP